MRSRRARGGWRALALGLLLLLVAATGCGEADQDGDGIATAGGTPSAGTSGGDGSQRPDGDDGVLEFSRCMRANGVPEFPDPKIGEDGGHSLNLPDGIDPAKVEAAQQKCREHLPNGGEPPEANPEAAERMREYSRCMRANGVPNFPDPVDGGLALDLKKLGLSGPDDPRLTAAEDACRGHMPPPPSGAPPPQTRQGG